MDTAITADITTPARATADVSAVLIGAAAVVVVLVFLVIVGRLATLGLDGMTLEFLIESPAQAGREGGIFPVLVSTLMLLGVCAAVSLPLGVGTALFLTEVVPVHGPVATAVRRTLDVLAAVPSIVFGLFGNALFCKLLGLGFSIAAGGLTLACMVLPILIRATEEGLRAVPPQLRMAAAGLGLTRPAVIRHVLLPAAMPALVGGMMLGLGRAMAETAALIFTSGYVDRMPASVLDSGRSLSVHIYDLSMNVPGGDRNAARSAIVLVCMLGFINLMARRLARLPRNKEVRT